MNDIAELTLRINSLEAEVAKQRLENLTSAGQKNAMTADVLEGSWKKLAAVLGPAVLGAAFLHAIKSAIELQERYVRLAEIAGTTSSVMSSFDLPARLAGASLDSVAMSIARLGKSIGEARLGDAQKQGIFRALGINVNDGRDAAAVFVDVAKATMGMKDQTVAAAVSQQLLSRGFAEMRPLMKEITEQGTLVARTTNEQNEAAKKFQDTLTKLSFEMENSKIKIANDYLPALQEIAKAFNDGYKEGGLLLAVVRGIQTTLTGTDLHKANVEIFELTNKQMELERQIARGAESSAIASPLFRRGLNKAQQELDEVSERLKTVINYKKMLEDPGSITRSTPGSGGGAPAAKPAGAGKSNAAERAIRELMEFQKTYDARVAAEKGFSERYADAIKTTNILAQEAHKQGLLSDVDLIKQLSANEDARLRVLLLSLENQKALHQRKGDLGKTAEAEQAIAQTNAAILANEAITGAKISSLMSDRVREYERWRQSVLETGMDIARSLLDERDQEVFNYEERKAALEVYLQENRDQIANAHELRLKLELEHQAKLGKLEAQGQLQRMRLERMSMREKAEFYFGQLEQITAAGAQHNKTLFQLNKAAGMANTIISTYTGAAKALEWGFPLGPIFAGIIVAAGLANLAAIASTQYGSTSSPPSVGAGGATPVTPAPVAGQSGGSDRSLFVVELPEDGAVSSRNVRKLFDMINEEMRDGGRLEISTRSGR